MTNPDDKFRPDVPSPARMYDYYLGGKDHYPADRDAAEKVIAMLPSGATRGAARANREFLGRAVRYLVAEAGIRQLLDIGTGLPTMGNVHEVAGSVADGCHTVYVDNDPVVLAHSREMLTGSQNAVLLRHDLREPEAILADPALRELIDFGRPVGLLLVAILHFIGDDEDPAGIVARLLATLPSGSHLVISHASSDVEPTMSDIARLYQERVSSGLYARTRTEITSLFDGLVPVPPGLAWIADWRPDLGVQRPLGGEILFGGVGRKP